MKKEARKRTPEQTTKIMKLIKSSGSQIELSLAQSMTAMGLRYRKQYRKVPGTPDFAFPAAKVAVFCDSEFWHGFDWKRRRKTLKSNRSYWLKKIERNMERDKAVDEELRNQGWFVMRFWGDEIQKDPKKCAVAIHRRVKRVFNNRKNP